MRPRVTHSAAHRNIRQKRPWMEYSGTTSWGSEGKKSVAWCQDRPKLQWHRGIMMFKKCQPTVISELKGLWLAIPSLLGGKGDQADSKKRKALLWATES